MKETKRIWKQDASLEGINIMSRNTLVDHLGIVFTEIGDSYLRATMPVDHRTVQPMGLLHGGASVSLAETMGSVASILCIENSERNAPVGVEINANHLNPARSGHVTATVRPIKVGRRIHVWQIEIEDGTGRQVCISRLTTMIIEK